MTANVGSRWNAGNLEFYDIATGITILSIAAGTQVTTYTKQGVIADIATADGANQGAGYVQADVESIATLSNAEKVKINAILAALRSAGIITT